MNPNLTAPFFGGPADLSGKSRSGDAYVSQVTSPIQSSPFAVGAGAVATSAIAPASGASTGASGVSPALLLGVFALAGLGLFLALRK